MKRIWTIISILALANVLAIGGFVGWLQTSGRLDESRVRRLRELFAPTIAEETKAKEAEAAKQAEEKKKAEEEAKSTRPPITAADRLELSEKGEEVRRQKMASLDKQVEALKNSLQIERETLDKERTSSPPTPTPSTRCERRSPTTKAPLSSRRPCRLSRTSSPIRPRKPSKKPWP